MITKRKNNIVPVSKASVGEGVIGLDNSLLNVNGNPNQVLRSELDSNWKTFPGGLVDIFSSITLQPDSNGFKYQYYTDNFYQYGIIPGELYEYRFSVISSSALQNGLYEVNLFIGSDIMGPTRYIMSNTLQRLNTSNAYSRDMRSNTMHIVARDYIIFQGGLGGDPIELQTARFTNYRRVGTKLEF